MESTDSESRQKFPFQQEKLARKFFLIEATFRPAL
jgi:hypothetical protein